MSKYYLGNTGEEIPEQLNLDTDATSPVQYRSDADAIPETTATYDLGSAAKTFAEGHIVSLNSTTTTATSGVFTGAKIGPAGAKQIHIDGQDAVPQSDNSFVLGKSTRRFAKINSAIGVFGTGVASPSGVLEGKGDATFTSIRTPSEAIVSASTIASVDLSRSCMFRLNLNHDATITAFTNAKDGAEYTILVKNIKPSGTITWPATVAWAGASTPTITKTLNKYDLITLKYFAGIDKFFGTISQNYT